MRTSTLAPSLMLVIACGAQPHEPDAGAAVPDADPGELVVSADFTTLPSGDVWAYFAGGVNDLLIDPQFGDPAPSLYSNIGFWTISSKQSFPANHQTMLASVQVSVVATGVTTRVTYSHVTLRIGSSGSANALGVIRLHLSNILGQSAMTVRVQCTEEQLRTLGGMPQGTIVTGAFDQQSLHKLQLEITPTGLHASMDGVDYCVDSNVTSATGDMGIGLGFDRDRTSFSGDGVWMDNLLLYRGR